MRDERLSRLLSSDSTSLTTGVWDPLSARLASRAGFPAVMLSGYSVAATYLGEPDFGIITQSEMLDVARRTIRASGIPVLVDGDTGGGNAVNVQRLVSELVDMGAAGVFLEDQVWPKRCGHMREKAVTPAEEYLEKLRAAVEARGDADLIIVGRTDARGPLGLAEAIRRGRMWRDAGADVVFVEAPESLDELRTIRAELDGPLLANMVEGGKTPILPLAELEALGFEMVVYPVMGLLTAARAIEAAFAGLRGQGVSRADPGSMMGFEEFGDVVGLPDKYELERRFRSRS
jgi:2-methylisocitrate lyase-like PEP mutase family enzyme